VTSPAPPSPSSSPAAGCSATASLQAPGRARAEEAAAPGVTLVPSRRSRERSRSCTESILASGTRDDHRPALPLERAADAHARSSPLTLGKTLLEVAERRPMPGGLARP
jgi:hypothetical protein